MRANILLADDSVDDRFLVTYALKRAGLDHCVLTADNGEQAIEFLNGTDRLPDLVLLDLKMPKVSGFEVLEWIQGKPELEALHVVVVSSSDLPEDRERAKDLGAEGYFVKTSDMEELVGMVSDLDTRFLKRVST